MSLCVVSSAEFASRASYNSPLSRWRRGIYLALSAGIQWFSAGRGHAEDHVDYRFEFYKEEGHRVEVSTHSLLFDKKIIEGLGVKGELVYDSISGASPIGKANAQLYPLRDIRRAGSLEVDWRAGRNELSPQISYSYEGDYISYGVALNDAIDFNQKNTTLRFGVAHNFDSVQPASFPQSKPKDTTDALIGVSQLLSPTTLATADLTLGYDTGYLNDPYKKIVFAGWGDPNAIFDENRPGHRSREVLHLSVTQFIKPLNASVEGAYRFYHDSYGIDSHTVTLTWHQNLGKHVILEPMFRFYEQSAADFYFLSVPGLLPSIPDAARPAHYSADYRLSHLMSFDYGLQATVLVTDWLHFNVGYRRYEMSGLDHVTASANYPKANVFTVGLRLWF